MATRDLAVKIFGDSTDINKAFGQAGDGAEGMGTRFAGMATKVAGVGVAIGGAVVVAKGFADAAGDLGEAQSKANVIFGDGYDAVSLFAEGASALGLSERAATDFASGFGGLLKMTDLGEDAVSGMSTEMTALTADLGSFNNMASDDVALKLLSGLRGETEGLKAMNIIFSAADVEARAFAMGLADVNGEVSEAAKVQARYALIMEQSTDAQGDFERTSDGLANSQKLLGAEWENMQAVIGEKLAPVFAKVFGKMAEVLPQVIDWLGPKLTAAGEGLAAFWDEKGPGIIAFFESIGSVLSSAWDIIKPIFGEDGLFTKSMEAIGTIFTGVVTVIQGILDGDWTTMWNGIKDIVSGGFDLLWTWFDSLADTFIGVGGDIMGWIGDGIESAISAVGQAIWDGLPGPVKWGLEYGAGGVGAAAGFVGGAFNDDPVGEAIAAAQGLTPGTAMRRDRETGNTTQIFINDVSGAATQRAINEAQRQGAGAAG